MDNILEKYWTGSFTGIDKLYRAIKADGHQISRKQVGDWLRNRFTYQLHKPIKKKFPRKAIVVSGPNVMWDVDLLDLKEHVKFNFKYRYILTVLDVFSRKAYGEALTNKTSLSTSNAFRKILAIQKPEAIRTDHGNEFKREFNQLLKATNINHILTSSPEIKANYVERFHRTFRDKLAKYMTYNNERNWTKIYKTIIENYNNTPHRSIKNIAPNAVNEQNIGELLQYMLHGVKYKDEKDEYKLGDVVRISVYKRVFTKASKETFTDELFIITKISKSKPKLYTIRDLFGEMIVGKFYGQELQLAEPNAIDHKRIAKAINMGNNKFKVSFKNWPKAHDTVLTKKKLKEYKKPK